MLIRMKVGRCCCVVAPVLGDIWWHGQNTYDNATKQFSGAWINLQPIGFGPDEPYNFKVGISKAVSEQFTHTMSWLVVDAPTQNSTLAQLDFDQRPGGPIGERGFLYSDHFNIFTAIVHWLFMLPDGGEMTYSVQCELENDPAVFDHTQPQWREPDPFAVGFQNTGSTIEYPTTLPGLRDGFNPGALPPDPTTGEVDGMTGQFLIDATTVANEHYANFNGVGQMRLIFLPVSPIPPGTGPNDSTWLFQASVPPFTGGPVLEYSTQ